MEIFIVALVISSLISTSFAAPRNRLLEERQRDKTYTITCLGPSCPDYPPTTLELPTSVSIPGSVNPPKTTSTPKPVTTTKPSTPKTSSTPPPVSTKKSTVQPTSKYTPPPDDPPSKTQKPPSPTTGEVGPSSTRCPVPLYYQCGGYYDGKPWTGCTKCVSGANCVPQNDFYNQCVAVDD
ncbi:hypothetical protein BDV96DRAFT_645262 [Lophiotrema nucula]|uniref:CBM1 domain-containing protein n=1 Tax=Lophiotrema nucula TaxID=690887 RepID=A0A6A5ZEU1_9PLEO|nr:hypothetical protein BDV96DRAFT_645262 [Lophiotrema nucula]